ncbi:hypothetical protein Nmel_007091 [Mimus melanotis]
MHCQVPQQSGEQAVRRQ